MTRLRVEHLTGPGVHDVTLLAGNGECIAIHGPSGSGKSLLLRAIADLDEASGEVWLDDQPRSTFSGPDWRRQVSYLAAESHWWNDLVGPHADDWRSGHLATLGFSDDVLSWEVQRLSSGERQRLALARALAHSPRALLLDEPTANLDGTNAARVETLLDKWRTETGGCILWVSHDPAQRRRIATQQYTMRAGTLVKSDAE
ncbi:MAG: ATP-binding cassette domain-containing protein [Gammaproteobacteria bacterium]|nr:ATP-binding cassette domain-containing protein [Gammaproteobacteria bacterium]